MPSLRNMTHRAPTPRVNALVAAAALVSRDAITNTISANATARAAAWQDIAWEHYETCGELRFACEWLGNSLSRARLFAARHRDADAAPEPEPDGSPAAEAMKSLAGGADGQAEMLKRFGAHLTVPGESFLVGWDDPETGAQHWLTLCNDEISEDAARNVTIQYLGEKLELPEEALIIRFWRPHPRRHWEANSPARGLDQILTELQKLTMHVGAQADSRLAGAGLLILPNETTFPPPPADAAAPPAALIPGAPSAPAQLAGFYASLADAMVKPIVDRDQASAVVPLVIQVPGEQVANVKHISFATELSKAALELRQEAIRRLAMGLDMPAEILTGMGDMNHWCVDEQTEALTRANGWVRHSDLRIGDEVRTLNHDTGLAEWQPVRDIYRAQVVGEPMRELESRTHSSLTTLNHRWPIIRPRQQGKVRTFEREWARTDELGYAHAITLNAPAADLPDTPKYADDLVELVAWFWTEGNISAVRPAVSIAQSHTVNPARVALISGALTRLYGPAQAPGEPLLRGDRPAWRAHPQANTGSFGGPITVFYLNPAASAPLLAAAPGKRPTNEFVCALTRAQLELFIDVSCQGDGHHYRFGMLDIWQRDPAGLDAFELALILSGRGVSRLPGHQDGTAVRALKATTVRPVKAAQEMRRTGRTGATDQVIAYTGTVWCPVTGNGTWMARRHGRVYFTGNSAWQVDEAAVKTHIEPLLQLICTGLTDSYLRPILGEDPATSDLVVSYDVSGLKQRPDRSGVAKDLYTLGELSGEALRREAGFGDADAPGPAEVRRKVLQDLVERAAIDAATAAQILVLLGILDAGDLEAAPAAGELAPAPAPPAPQGDAGPPSIPARPPADAAPDSGTAPPPPAAAMLTAAALLGRHVMDYAGKRLMKGSGGRSVRGQNRDVPTWELHTRIPVPPDQIDAVLEGAYAPFAADTGASLIASPVLAAVDAACRAALLTGRALTDEALAARLRDAMS